MACGIVKIFFLRLDHELHTLNSTILRTTKVTKLTTFSDFKDNVSSAKANQY